MTSLSGIDSLLTFLRSATQEIENPISFPGEREKKTQHFSKKPSQMERLERVVPHGLSGLLEHLLKTLPQFQIPFQIALGK